MVFGLDQLVIFMQQYGYIAFFILAFFETTAAPIPSEVVLPFAGALIALGTLNPIFLYTIILLGNLAGNTSGFWIAYFVGTDVVLKYGRKMGFKMDNYAQAEKWIKQYGVFFAFFTELLPVVRSVTSIVCGAFKMSFKKFVAYTVAGFAIWSGVLMYSGYLLASNWTLIATFLSEYSIYVVVATVLISVILLRKRIYSVLKALYNGPKKTVRSKRKNKHI
jgi:membrane protein DedA with SNARE-associated domain